MLDIISPVIKNTVRISRVILFLITIFLIHSCKKDKSTLPVISTTAVTAITRTTVLSGGNITVDGGATIISRGVCWSTNILPSVADNKTIDGAGAGSFVSLITGLTTNTTYFVRAYATNSSGTGYGMAMSFTTQPATIPVLTTTDVIFITYSTASSGGAINSDGGAPVTARGVCWNTTVDPTVANNKTNDGPGTGSFASSLTELIAGTTYYVRAYATNSAGTGYGNTMSFTTQIGIIFNPNLTYGSLTDIEGNVYKTITIGTQTWMAENLKTIKYNDGTAIPLVTESHAWQALSTPGYCWYNNDATYHKATYGALYNWYTVNNGNLCPTGWHIPSDAEWTRLTTYLGGESVAGGKLKETGTAHWLSPNTGATNSSGFTALPGGKIYLSFEIIGYLGYWWSSTESNINYSWSMSMHHYRNDNFRDPLKKQHGFSVRCLKD